MYPKTIQAVLDRQHLTAPTLIQTRTFELIKNGASLVAYARTGTGKTLAYALPALSRVTSGRANQLVIIAPTTELAVQIRHVLNPFIAALGLHGISLVGAGNRKRQDDQLKKQHPEVIVATPGRFFDFFSSGRIKIPQIQSLIIDEADDLLEFTKLELLTSLGQNLASSAQICLFGATESAITTDAENRFQRSFILVDVRPEQKLALHHYFLQVDNRHKVDDVQKLIKLHDFRGILFFASNQAMLRFAGILGHTKTDFALLANDFSKARRERALKALGAGKIRLLLATDVAARGLDIPNLTHVVNFDLPHDLTTYTHRAGRVGRMNATGFVVTLGDDHDQRELKKLLAPLTVARVYFVRHELTTTKPVKVTPVSAVSSAIAPKHKRKHKKNKNKGYHPHYLKD